MTDERFFRLGVLPGSTVSLPRSLSTVFYAAMFFAATVSMTAISTAASPLSNPQETVNEPAETQPLTATGDIALQMVEGIDRFLLKEVARSAAARPAQWELNQASAEAFEESLAPHRQLLARQIGAQDPRIVFEAPTVTAPVGTIPEVGQNDLLRILPIRWPVLSDPSPQGQGLPSTYGEGLLLLPKTTPVGDVVVVPDADQTPEQLAGLDPAFPAQQQSARILANLGFASWFRRSSAVSGKSEMAARI